MTERMTPTHAGLSLPRSTLKQKARRTPRAAGLPLPSQPLAAGFRSASLAISVERELRGVNSARTATRRAAPEIGPRPRKVLSVLY
jgi:hypothetical protein